MKRDPALIARVHDATDLLADVLARINMRDVVALSPVLRLLLDLEAQLASAVRGNR